MRGIDELDHYELLEIGRDATKNELDRAYRTAQATYADGSLALYSVFERSDAGAIRERLDEAYRVLSDPELRGLYDEEVPAQEKPAARSSLGVGSMVAGLSEGAPGAPLANGYGREEAGAGAVPSHVDGLMDAGSVDDAVEEFDALEDDGRGEFDGVRLRRNRLFRGFEIDDISEVTKVSGAHLRNIEAENFDDLPADVYVRGFLTAYARTIGLDPQIVVPSYMARVAQSRTTSPPGGFLARR